MANKVTNYNVIGFDGVSEVIGGVDTVTTLMRDPDGNVLFAVGTTVPTDATSGFAKGCLFIDTDVADGTGALYLNKGVSTSAAFTLVTQA
jgi:hypothetical protein